MEENTAPNIILRMPPSAKFYVSCKKSVIIKIQLFRRYSLQNNKNF